MDELVDKANQRAQRRFRAMVAAQTYADPTDRHTRLYVQAERLLETLTGDGGYIPDALYDATEAAQWRAEVTWNEVIDFPVALGFAS